MIFLFIMTLKYIRIKEKDKRIKMIKNKKKETLYSRYIRELNANSKYITVFLYL